MTWLPLQLPTLRGLDPAMTDTDVTNGLRGSFDADRVAKLATEDFARAPGNGEHRLTRSDHLQVADEILRLRW